MAVVEDEVERDFGITLAVFCQPCAHITTCKPQGHGNAQHTLRRVGTACRSLGGGVQGIQRVAALTVVFFACFGQMAAAYFMAHASSGNVLFPLANQGESAVLFCFVFLYLAVAGGGAWALDNVFGKDKD